MSSIGGGNKGPAMPPANPGLVQAEQMNRAAAASGAIVPKAAPKAGAAGAGAAAEAAPAAAPATARRASAAEVERATAQSGFARVGPKKRRGYEMDDVTDAPIPLPREDVDASSWDQKGLDEAQQGLTLAGQNLKEAARGAEPGGDDTVGLFERLLASAYSPTEEDNAGLEALAQAPPAAVADLATVAQSLRQHFQLEAAALSSGSALVAASLVVAGLSDTVQPRAAGLDAGRMGEGMQQLVDRSNAAVRDARQMHSGISLELARQRTFVHKR